MRKRIEKFEPVRLMAAVLPNEPQHWPNLLSAFFQQCWSNSQTPNHPPKPTPVAVRPRERSRATEMKPLFVTIFAFVLSGCVEKRPEWIFIPASGYRCEVRIEVPARMKVGEEVVLKGERENGPWRRVRPEEARPDVTPWTKQPPLRQSGFDVTGNVRWIVSPPGAATFGGVERRERTVRFSMPGIYTIKAESAFPTLTYSNEVQVVVE